MTFQQMLKTLWNRKLTIIVSVVVCVAAALGYAKLATPTYQSSALVQINAASSTGTTSSSSFTLPDPVQELSSTAVQDAAATALHDPDPSALAGQVSGSVDPTTGALTVTGSGSTPEEAQAVATAYADAFVDQIQVLAQGQVDKYTVALAGISTKISALQAQEGSSSAANNLLQTQIQALEQSYAAIQTDLSNVQVGMPYAQVQVKAQPGGSTGLSKSKLLLIGLLAGLLVGCGIAFVREQFDDSLRLDPDIESVIDGPLLGELPEDADVKKGAVSIALVQAPQSSLSEAVRDLRTSLRVLLVDQQSPAVVVTSPAPGDGKTFVTANLAASWALTGSRVIVVSADFRRPRLEEVFGLDVADRPGLSDLIKANWKQAEPDDEPADRSTESRPRPWIRAPSVPSGPEVHASTRRRSAPTCSRRASTASSSCPSASTSTTRASCSTAPACSRCSTSSTCSPTSSSSTPRPSWPPPTRPSSAASPRGPSSWRRRAGPTAATSSGPPTASR